MRETRPGFSLVEVVIAVAIVGVAVLAVLGLLASLARHSADARERQTAVGLADAVAVELRRQVVQSGWESILAAVSPGEGSRGLLLVAPRDGSDVRPLPTGEYRSDSDRFFLIEARRIADPALANSPDWPAVPLRVRVMWPYRPDLLSSPDLGSRSGLSQLEYTQVLNR